MNEAIIEKLNFKMMSLGDRVLVEMKTPAKYDNFDSECTTQIPTQKVSQLLAQYFDELGREISEQDAFNVETLPDLVLQEVLTDIAHEMLEEEIGLDELLGDYLLIINKVSDFIQALTGEETRDVNYIFMEKTLKDEIIKAKPSLSSGHVEFIMNDLISHYRDQFDHLTPMIFEDIYTKYTRILVKNHFEEKL